MHHKYHRKGERQMEKPKVDLTKLQEADVEKHFILTPEEKAES